MTNGRPEAPTDGDGALDWSDVNTAPHFPATVVAINAISPEGFPITLTLNDPGQGAMTKWLVLLQKQGFTPAANPTPAGGTAQAAAGAIPTCPNRNCSKHGKPMEPSQHKPGFYCKGGKDPVSGNPKGYCKAEVNS